MVCQSAAEVLRTDQDFGDRSMEHSAIQVGYSLRIFLDPFVYLHLTRHLTKTAILRTVAFPSPLMLWVPKWYALMNEVSQV